MEAPEIEARLCEVLAARGREIAAAWLFGSVARGTARTDSDVDVAVLFARPPGGALDGPVLALEGVIERALGLPAQVVSLDEAPVDLAIRVLREGRLLLDTDRSARIQFEVRTRNEFFDLEPTLRRYRLQGEVA